MIKSLRKGDQGAIRISDADREVAAERLQEALAEGRITLAELETRLEAVYAALHADDLRQPLAGLPGGAVVALPAAGAIAGKPTVLRVGASGLKRSGDWLVPASLQVKGGMGSVVLEFCDAELRHRVVHIELKLGAGSIEVVLPDRATADVDGLVATMGAVKSTVPAKPEARTPHFVLSGHTRMGSATVRRRRRFAGLRF